ncbi:hypothetical protein ACFL47_03360 [Candidatus Latescibacterota bacterium]
MKKQAYMIGFVLLLTLFYGCSKDESHDNSSHDHDHSSHEHTQEKAEAAHGEESISINDLSEWQFLGIGEVKVDEGEKALYMSEGADSKGVTLVSPKQYGKSVVVSYKIKPLSFESVHVLILSATDKASGGDIIVPSDYDGNFGFWTNADVQDYVFALHNEAHNRKPFITKNPGSNLIIEAEENVVGEQWHDIEIGRHDTHLYMKIDGKMVVENMDESDSLPGGKIGFRLRGIPGKAAAALLKDVVIHPN